MRTRKFKRLWWVAAVVLSPVLYCRMDGVYHASVHFQVCALSLLQMEPAKGAGFLAMYEAIGGKVSTA